MRGVIQLFMLFIGAAAWCLAADPTWIHLENENFHIYSSASAGETRSTLNYFERIRSFFIELTGEPPAKPVPIYIIAFGTEKEYQPYRLNEYSIAYYNGQAERDYIVLGRTGEEAEQIATHEYTHLVFRHAGYKLPPWLNEGLAELFSTMTERGKDAIFGRPIAGRLQELQRGDWAPLKTILGADQTSPYYNESKRVGSLYNEGWALAHMLTTTDEYSPKFDQFFEAVLSGTTSVEALEKVYGKALAKIEDDLQWYVRGAFFQEIAVQVRMDDMEKLPVAPADSFDVRYVQADLLLGLKDRRAEGLKRMEDLARENPKRPEPQSTLAYAMWQDGKQEEAIEHFSAAFAGGARTPKLLWDFARLALRARPKETEQAMAELIKLDPSNADYRRFLANLQTQQNGATGASGPRDFVFGDEDDDEPDETNAGGLAKNEVLVPAPERPEDKEPKKPVVVLQTVIGTMVEFQCNTPPHMILDTEQGRKDFVVLTPEKLIVTGATGGAEFTCGTQKPGKQMRLQYSETPEGTKADGVVRAIHFGE